MLLCIHTTAGNTESSHILLKSEANAMTYEQHSFVAKNPSSIRSIVVADTDVPVEVLTSGDGSLRATYFESDKETYDIEMDGDTLTIKKVQPLFGLFMLRMPQEDVQLTLYLPARYNGDLSVTTVDGDIRVHGVTMTRLAVKATDGNIAVTQCHIGGSISCRTTDGDLALAGSTALEAALKTVDGDIMLDRPLVSNLLSCRTTDGDIHGLLAGRASDYTLQVSTVDGRSNLRSGGTGKTVCNIKTIDGKIRLSFEDGE